MKVCVVTDNNFIFKKFKELAAKSKHDFDFYYSTINKSFKEIYENSSDFKSLSLKECNADFFNMYDVFISLHCKQFFPNVLVDNYRCINVHPGLNPYNRGWFPQVFSILNKKPVGVTIHEMDNELDHGPIIWQTELEIFDYETSYDVYLRIQDLEIKMLEEHLDDMITGNYTVSPMKNEGNINYKSDFDSLCCLDLNRIGTFEEFLNILRATTFNKYDNAYFIDSNGNKVYVSVNLKKNDI